jgi:hypothetical protein
MMQNRRHADYQHPTTPEHEKRMGPRDTYIESPGSVPLHPEILAAYEYVDKAKLNSDYIDPPAWHGWAIREAFLAGISYVIDVARLKDARKAAIKSGFISAECTSHQDGHDWEGFLGGCKRMECPPGCSMPADSLRPVIDLTNDELDLHLDTILKAAGSTLRNYSTQKLKDDMRAALRGAIAAGAQ